MSKAYTYYVNPVGSGAGEDDQVHVTSSSWVLTFICWKYRDTYRVDDSINNSPNQNVNALSALKATLDPLIVVNDCIGVSVTCNKNTFTPNMEATLLQTDVNYLTAVAPGDFVLINMVNWQSKADDIYQRANSEKTGSINGFSDGFKGIFKIQSVRRITAIIDPATGKKGVVFKITGHAFTEFNNMLYFDPSVALQTKDIGIFAKQISEVWEQLINANKDLSIQDLIKTLIVSFIGSSSPKSAGAAITGNQFQTPNDKFFMPAIIGNLLNIPKVTVAADIYNYWFGLQKYSNTGPHTSPQLGLNPDMNGDTSDDFYYTTTPVAGRAILAPEYWNQVKAWDILNQYTNAPLNEFFTCFRADPADGTILPTVVLRQIPFTNEDFYTNNKISPGSIKTTMFLSIPRWKISPTMVISQDIGRDEALRINYVQVFARMLQVREGGADYTLESANHNYQFDINDIQRSGLKPKVSASMFDLFSIPANQKSMNSPNWAKIHADAMIGGHLKMSGTFVCAGIEDPIAIGDNLEFEDVVYHIEQVVHTCSIDPASGIKIFRTIIGVSQGISIYSNATNGTSYPEMSYTNAYAEREWDNKNKGGQILPGVSESQATPARLPNVDDVESPLDEPNTSLPQPKQTRQDSTPNTKNIGVNDSGK
jgi:hypothetical protein